MILDEMQYTSNYKRYMQNISSNLFLLFPRCHFRLLLVLESDRFFRFIFVDEISTRDG